MITGPAHNLQYRCIWDDITDPGPTAAVGIELLRSQDVANMTLGQSVYSCRGNRDPAAIWKRLVHLKLTKPGGEVRHEHTGLACVPIV